MNLCKEIRLIQKKKKITNPEAAKVVGVTAVNYSRKMNNNLMKAEDLEKLCDYLGLEIIIKEKE